MVNENLRYMPIVTVEQVVRFREAVFAEIERLQRENEMLEELTDRQSKHISDLAHENEELREELAALKASTEPVFWVHPMDIARFPSVTLVKVSDEQIPLITQDQAAALVEDFRERAVIVCEAHASHWKTFGSSFYSSVAEHLKKKIESLPLIKGEK